ncbi:MAG: phosphoribosylformylglycinamidine synthase [Bacteriovorax sp.]|nr:phosphoribosylformylglycinamidine synthase [Bacteriovorax sp.]
MKAYRFEIYPNTFNLSQTTTAEESLKVWFKEYMKVSFDKFWEVRYFLVESKNPIENFEIYASEVFTDSVMETLFGSMSDNQEEYHGWLKTRGFKNPYLIDIGFRPGVTDNSAHAALEALKLIPALSKIDMKVSSGSMFYVEGENLPQDRLEKMTYEKMANFLLHKVTVTAPTDLFFNSRLKNIVFPNVQITASKSEMIDLTVDDSVIAKMNQDNCWALSVDELTYIKSYYKNLGRNPSDVEMEVIAQSWSEHCKHKIFSSEITYSESNLPEGVKPIGDKKINGIFKSLIRGSTLKIKEERKLPWLISIFHDNAGIVRFDDKVDVCIKVETHNSPSALDPYGGALTGILGVNRDILGVGLGAKPIANTSVFCLAENKYFQENNFALPLLLKNPDRIKAGVHQGVQDGGNKSGIPTVNGAFVFDRDYVGKPLVFCGTIGVIPQTENNKSTAEKGQRPGDLIVMAGGRIGKDGIHGATFSSMELVDGVPSSVVQIGDPITQKRLGDFLIEARIKGLFNSVTDNGAGGLSSSIGEMAQLTNGADVDLEKALVKYPGLSPFELMVSESQERMTFSVAVDTIDAFLALAAKRNVEASVIGTFTDSGSLHVKYNNETVADLSLEFLHESLVPMKLNAHFDMETKSTHWIKRKIGKPLLPRKNYKKILMDLFRSPNIRSHEHLVRRYDHEVKGATLVKPFTGSADVGFSAPSDAGVIWMKPHGGSEDNAIAIACGICPKVSEYDTYLMAEYALDEAVRNAVCVGANPDEMVLVDNYCWPDPIESSRNPDAKLKLGQLVRASQALYDLSLSYGMPFVSGKDSMKNDFIGKTAEGDIVKISVPPTLLVTAMGRVPGLKTITTSEVKNEDSLVYLIGENLVNFTSAYELKELYADYDIGYPLPYIDGKKQMDLYRKFHTSMKAQLIESSHDVSDGGVLIALAEKMMGTNYGMELDFSSIAEKNLLGFMFNESAGRFVVSVSFKNQKQFEDNLQGHSFLKLGQTTKSGILEVTFKGEEILNVKGTECMGNYKIQAEGIV